MSSSSRLCAVLMILVSGAALCDEPDWPGAHLFVGVRGLALDSATRAFLAEARPAGVILLKENIQDEAQTKALVASIKSAAGMGGELWDLPLICVDQEGGPINRLRLPEAPGAREIAERDVQYARAVGERYARECRARGIAMVLAPVLDVYQEGANTFLLKRTFGNDAETVSRFGLAFAEGLAAGGVAAVGKHFPGHGASVQDSHKALATLPLRGDDLDNSLLPFDRAAHAGIAGIMTGHIACEALDATSAPATLSRPMIQDVLRARMGFDGLVITDDMNMGAIRGETSLPVAAVKALAAGNDIALVCENDPIKLKAVVQAVKSAKADGSLAKDQMDLSFNRVRQLQARLRSPLKQEN